MTDDYPHLDLEKGEAPWWHFSEYPTTQDRIEAMKRQDPDYNGDD